MKMIIDFIKKNKNAFYLYGALILTLCLLILIAVTKPLSENANLDPYQAYDSIAIRVFGFEIAWYAIFILAGIVMAAILAHVEFKRVGWDSEILIDGLIIAVPLAILGTRIYYVIFNWNQFVVKGDFIQTLLSILGYSNGQFQLAGLAIHGGIIVTIIFLIFFSRRKKISFWVLVDILAVGFLVGQISGRWGNFMNHELYGPSLNENSFLAKIIPDFILKQMVFDGVLKHPTFLYESLWNFIGLVFLLIIRRKRVFKAGDMLGLYLIWYGLGRGAIIEPLRLKGDPNDPIMFLGLPVNVIASLAIFIPAGLAIIFLKRKYTNQPYYFDLLIENRIEENND